MIKQMITSIKKKVEITAITKVMIVKMKEMKKRSSRG